VVGGLGHDVDVGMQDWWECDPERVHLPGFGVFDSLHVKLEEDARKLPREERSYMARRLFAGQAAWASLPRLANPVQPKSANILPFLPAIRAARARRPSVLMQATVDPLDYAGIFWKLEDFEEYKSLGPQGEDLWEILVEMRAAQEAVIKHARTTGRMLGEQISEAGCRSVGLAEEVIQEMLHGRDLPFTEEPAPFHAAPYSGMYSSVEALIAGSREFLRTLKLGKLLPVWALPQVESPTTVLCKVSDSEVGGFKYRICTDLTFSGVNPLIIKLPCPMVSLEEFMSAVGPGTFIDKQDVTDFFLVFPLARKYVRFFGVQCPLTGQSLVYCFYPFGARMSPPVTCRLMKELSRAVVTELRRRERGEAPGEAFAHIAVEARPGGLDHSRNHDPGETSSLFITACTALASFVDDKFSSACSMALGKELMAIAGWVYHVTGAFEKLKKRAWPSQLQEVLGRLVDTIEGAVSVPSEKRAALLLVVRELLACFSEGAQVCITVDRLSTLVGKLQDATAGYEGASFFMAQLRLPLTLVMHLLPLKRQRIDLLITLFMFPRMYFSLEAWEECLQDAGACRRYYVQESGYFGLWRWAHNFFERPLPSGVFSAATDASKKAGAVTFAGARLLHTWEGAERGFHINILEALMPVWFLQECGSQIAGLRGVVWVDSMVALQALNSGRSKNVLIAAAARQFKLLCLRFSTQIWVAHIPTLENLEADYISRGVLGRRIADWGLSPRHMQVWLDYVGGLFHVDAFASPSGDNSRALQFCSVIRPAASFYFERNHVVWAFPPPSEAKVALQSGVAWECASVLLLVPVSDFEVSSWSAHWRQLRVFPSGFRSEGVFQRMVSGSTVPCKSPGFDLILLCRATDTFGAASSNPSRLGR
jgi:hypothetical protein